MYTATHPASDSLTLIRYADGIVHITTTAPDGDSSAERRELTLAEFVREIGIPVRAFREAAIANTAEPTS